VLTDRGRACVAAVIATIDGVEDRITATLGERGHRELRTLLRKLLDSG
jgi:DNA-binding MarR family transcriptional regulator